jgi:hypothetical protein
MKRADILPIKLSAIDEEKDGDGKDKRLNGEIK